MSDLLIGLLSALVATNPPAAVSNLVQQKTGLSVRVPASSIEPALQKLMDEDEAAQAEVDRWILERGGTGQTNKNEVAEAAFRARIMRRLEPVKKGYEDFIAAHPEHTQARLAYGGFLNDVGDETAAEAQWERARHSDPKNPATWDNLATLYGHNGNVRKAFEYYAKTIELAPEESVYYQNLATVVFLFRKDAMEYYHLTEQEIFAKAMDLYKKALALDPQNFRLAAEVAQTYYGITAPKTGNRETDAQAFQKLADEAMDAWRVALLLASVDLERESVQLHLARWLINLGAFADARKKLALVSQPSLNTSKNTLLKKLDSRESGKTATPPSAPAP